LAARQRFYSLPPKKGFKRMRLQLIVDFDGSPRELIALLPAQIDVQSFQRLVADDNGNLPGIVKLSGAWSHMDAAMVAQVYAAFDAGHTIDNIVAWSKFSSRAIASRRKIWKRERGLA
jgi:hypothetical protein